jgi:RNA polymerase sigma-70 factor, ECF subfamily
MRLRAALRNLRSLYGTWGRLAVAMDVPHGTLIAFACGKNGASHGLVVKAAKAAGVTIDRLIGAPIAADRCPTCGARTEGTCRPPTDVPPAHPDEELVFFAVAKLERMLRACGVPRADVDDVRQQIAIGAIMSIRAGRFRPSLTGNISQALRNWLIGIAFNVLGHFRERAHRRYEVIVENPYAVAPAPSIDPHRLLDAREAPRAFLELPAHHRELIAAATDNASLWAYAVGRGMNPHTAAKRLRVARAALRARLARRKP